MNKLALFALALPVLSLNGCVRRAAAKAGDLVPPVPTTHGSLDAMLLWCIGLGIIMFAAGVAALVLLPAKTLGTAVSAGGAALVATALLVRAALPFLPWIALAMLLIAAIWALYRGRGLFNSFVQTVELHEAAKPILDNVIGEKERKTLTATVLNDSSIPDIEVARTVARKRK